MRTALAFNPRIAFISGFKRLPALLLAGIGAVALTACGSSNQRPASSSSTPVNSSVAAEPAVSPASHGRLPGRFVEVGSSPEGIVVAPSSQLVVTATRNPAALVLLNPDTERVLRRLPISGAARHLEVDGNAGPVLVPEEPADTLLELSLPDLGMHAVKVGAHPHDAAAADGRVFVGDEFGRAVSVLEAGRVIGRVGGFLQPGGLAALDGEIAVVDVRGDSLTLIDARSLRVDGRIAAGAGPTHVVSGPGGRLYVLDTRGGAILSYSARPSLRRLSRLALAGAPYGVAIDRSRERLWVTLTAKNELVELRLGAATPSVVRTFATARQPNSVAVDERTGRVFVADAGDASVQVIQPSG